MTGTTDQGSRKAAFGILAQAGVDGHVKAGYPLAAKAEEAALLADWRAGRGVVAMAAE